MFKTREQILDSETITTSCLTCGQEITKSLRWFTMEENPPCPLCGGEVDKKPMVKAFHALAQEVEILEQAATLSGDTRH
jgi:peptide subunit release factor 1 (eRF1)